jgi:hypothetical protein
MEAVTMPVKASTGAVRAKRALGIFLEGPGSGATIFMAASLHLFLVVDSL